MVLHFRASCKCLLKFFRAKLEFLYQFFSLQPIKGYSKKMRTSRECAQAFVAFEPNEKENSMAQNVKHSSSRSRNSDLSEAARMMRSSDPAQRSQGAAMLGQAGGKKSHGGHNRRKEA